MQELKYEGHAEEGGVCATPALSVDITDPEWVSHDTNTRKHAFLLITLVTSLRVSQINEDA